MFERENAQKRVSSSGRWRTEESWNQRWRCSRGRSEDEYLKSYFYFLTQFQLCSARISWVSTHFTALMFESLCWTLPAAIRSLSLKHSAAKNTSYMFVCYANYGNYLPSAWMCGCSAPFNQVHIRYDLCRLGRARYPIMHFAASSNSRSNKWKFVRASLDAADVNN